jgi:hypothetical protein
MAVINNLVLARNADNTIQVDTAYYDLNTKAGALVDDLVTFLQAAVSDVDAYVPGRVDALFDQELGSTVYTQGEIDAMLERVNETTLASLGAQGAMYDPVSDSWTALGGDVNEWQNLFRGYVYNRSDEVVYFLNPTDWSYKYAWEYDANLPYATGAYCTLSGTTYKALQSAKGKDPATETTYWTVTADTPESILASTDGTDGAVGVLVPAGYTARYTRSGKSYFWCSLAPLPGLALDPAFLPGGIPVTHRTFGAYESILYDDSASAYIDGTGDSDATSLVDLGNDYLAPVSGKKPWTGLTRAENRALHSNFSTKAHLQDYIFRNDLLRHLFVCEHRTWDSESVIPGHCDDSYDYANVSVTGLTDYLGNGSGSYKPDTLYLANRYRGIENPFGDVWEFVDGINFNDWKPYITRDPHGCADDVDDTNSSYAYVRASDENGNVITCPDSSNYQKFLWPGTFLPQSVGGASSTYITDPWYQNPGWRVLRVGGRLSSGRQAGLGYLSAYSASTYANWNFGGRAALA